jgi:GT2 family glycosyltransferase
MVGKMWLIPASKIIHKDQNIQREQWRNFLDRRSRRIPFNRLWLFYFSVRNAVYLGRQQLSGWRFFVQTTHYFLKLCVGVLLYDECKIERLYCLFQAFKDGFLAHFDNDYPFKLRNSQQDG